MNVPEFTDLLPFNFNHMTIGRFYNFTNNSWLNGKSTYMSNISIGTNSFSYNTGNANAYGIGYWLYLIPGETYCVSATATNCSIAIFFFQEQHEYISFTSGLSSSGASFTIPENAYYSFILFLPTNKNSTVTVSNIQLELGSTATTYEPYNSNNTIYGGYVDLVKGELVQTHGYVLLNDGNNWRDTPGISRSYVYDHLVFPIDYSKGNAHGIKCTILPTMISGSNQDLFCRWYKDSTTYIYFAVRYSSTMTNPPTLDDFKQWSNEGKIAVSYELETPITYPLSK